MEDMGAVSHRNRESFFKAHVTNSTHEASFLVFLFLASSFDCGFLLFSNLFGDPSDFRVYCLLFLNKAFNEPLLLFARLDD